jgi:CMP-N-acetylneuraminic acid synthetase
MEADGRFIGDNPYMYVMSEQAGWDIDEQWQLDFAQGHNE